MERRPHLRTRALAALPWLLAALAPGVAAAQGTPSGATRSAQDIRAFLSVPAWYVNYDILVEAGLIRAHTVGFVTLDLRSQGSVLQAAASQNTASLDSLTKRLKSKPGSLTPAQVQMLLQAAGQPSQVEDAANWMPHPPPDDPAWSDAQRDAVMERYLDSLTVEQDVTYDAQGPTSSTHLRGAGRVQPHGASIFDVDVVKRTYVISLPWVFGDTKSSMKSLKGEHRALGDNGWEVRTEENGLTAYAPRGSTLTPDAGQETFSLHLSGALPAQLGAVSGQQVFQMGSDPSGGSKITVRYTASPIPPQPIELVIQPPADYKKWRPEGFDDEVTMGNTMLVTAVVQKTGGGDPPFRAARIRFELVHTSSLPGVCMNAPEHALSPAPFDYRFEAARNSAFLIPDRDGQAAVMTGGGLTTATATISSFDFGGWADLRVTAELDNGDMLVGVVEGTNGEQSLKIPSRPDDSHVADVYLDRYGVAAQDDRDDLDDEPECDKFAGDGLTLFEEYRGFIENDDWLETDPTRRDLFIVNRMRWHGSTWNGINLFKRVSELDVHPWLLDDEARSDGVINFNSAGQPHVVDQHVITIESTKDRRRGYANVDKVGTPGTARMLHMPAATWPTFLRSAPAGQPAGGEPLMYFAVTMAHELLHAVNVWHHGEADEEVTWNYLKTSSGVPYVQETDRKGNVRVNALIVSWESGANVDLDTFFADTKKMDVWLGIPHGQHSGAEDCLMRYDCSTGYSDAPNSTLRYLTCDEVAGTALCRTIVGTGVNQAGRRPRPRYSNASAPEPARIVNLQRGQCRSQIRVNDLGEEPHR